MSLSMLTDGKTAQGDDESEDLLTTAQVLSNLSEPQASDLENPAIDRRANVQLTQQE